jgi:hypothetical protein
MSHKDTTLSEGILNCVGVLPRLCPSRRRLLEVFYSQKIQIQIGFPSNKQVQDSYASQSNN